MVMIVIGILTIMGISLLGAMSGQFAIAQNSPYVANALLAAEAGVEQSVQQLNSNDDFGGYPAEQTFFNNTSQGRGVFTTIITDSPSDNNAKIITSESKVYRYGTSTNPISTRIVKATAVGTGSEGYSVYSGPGGLILGGSASITNSDIYVNGTLKLTGAAKIGTSSQPLNVHVANQVCPSGASPGPTYPQVCSGSQPISLDWSTNIYGTVCATGQTSKGPNNNIKPGSSGSGLQIGCVAPTVSMPSYNKATQTSAVTTTSAGNSNTYVCNSWPFDRTWPANLKLTGNVNVGGSCNVVIRGNTYITGDLDIGGASKITVDNSLGTARPVVLVDGKITVGGSAQLIANSSGTGIQFVSMKSNASCGSNCTSLSGNELKNTQSLETINVGGAANLPGMVFQAYWGKVTIAGSGNVGSAVGQTVDLSGAGTITFGTNLSSGERTWTITSYQQKYEHEL